VLSEHRELADRALALAASHTVGEYLLPGWLSSFRIREPRTSGARFAGGALIVTVRKFPAARRTVAAAAERGFRICGRTAAPCPRLGEPRLLVVSFRPRAWPRRGTCSSA
jgi:hypothetical protein